MLRVASALSPFCWSSFLPRLGLIEMEQMVGWDGSSAETARCTSPSSNGRLHSSHSTAGHSIHCIALPCVCLRSSIVRTVCLSVVWPSVRLSVRCLPVCLWTDTPINALCSFKRTNTLQQIVPDIPLTPSQRPQACRHPSAHIRAHGMATYCCVTHVWCARLSVWKA